MSTERWSNFAASIALKPGKQNFVSTPTDIADFERESGIKLPASYCEFATLFGAGELSSCYEIAVPGFSVSKSETYDLRKLNQFVHSVKNEVDEYSPDPARRRRFLFFAGDINSAYYAWDPGAVTDPQGNEYGIYVEFREWETVRLADSFHDFITRIAVGPDHSVLYTDPPQLTYKRA